MNKKELIKFLKHHINIDKSFCYEDNKIQVMGCDDFESYLGEECPLKQRMMDKYGVSTDNDDIPNCGYGTSEQMAKDMLKEIKIDKIEEILR